jgi:hypothetical protein
VLWAHFTDERIIRRQRFGEILHQGAEKGFTGGCRDSFGNGTHRRLGAFMLGEGAAVCHAAPS